MRKTLAALSLTIVCLSAYADPLDSQNFKEGVYKGTYGGAGCSNASKGTATLVVQNTSYKTGNGISTVSFSGNLKLSGAAFGDPSFADAFSDNGVNITAASYVQGPANGTDSANYSSNLVQSNGAAWQQSFGYTPSTHKISSETATTGSCKIYFDVTPQ